MAKELVKKHYGTGDIVQTILACDKKYRSDSALLPRGYADGTFRDKTKRVFDFVKSYIRYEEDPQGEQFVQRPATLLQRRVGDCKSMSLLTGSMLYALCIPYSYRFVSFGNDKMFTHVYIVAHGDQDIIIDPVYGIFDSEKPYTHKKDYMAEGLYIGAIKKRIGTVSQADAVKPLYDKWYPPVKLALDKLEKLVRMGIRPDKLTIPLVLIREVRRDIQNNPLKLLIYNSHANNFLAGNATWDQFLKALAVTLVYTPDAAIGNIFSDAGDAISKAWNSAGDFFGRVADAAGDKFRAFTDWSGKTITNAAEAAQSASEWIGNKASDVGTWVADGTGDFLRDPVQFTKDEIHEAWQNVKKGLFAGPATAFQSLVSLNFRGFANSLNSHPWQEVYDRYSRYGGDPELLKAAILVGTKTPTIGHAHIGDGGATEAAELLAAATAMIAAMGTLIKDAKKTLNDIDPAILKKAQDLIDDFNDKEADYAALGDPDAIQGQKDDKAEAGFGWMIPMTLILGGLVYAGNSGNKGKKKRK